MKEIKPRMNTDEHGLREAENVKRFGQDNGMNGDSLFVGMQEAAELLGVSRQTVWRMVKEGRLVKVPVKRGMMALRREDVLGVGNAEASGRRDQAGFGRGDRCHE
jgi:excisionase family DNA binding protein